MIIPLAKCSSPVSPSDFRPINLLCFLSKVLERLLYNQILSYATGKNILTKWQSGFRAGHSCETALLKVSNDIRFALDNNLVTTLVLLDFTKAFDSVNHSILLSKLRVKFNFDDSAVSFIDSFLSGRFQRVKILDDTSDWIGTTRGVPQGSILGPLLFCLFINDIQDIIEDVKIHLYADDVQLYQSSPIGLIDDLTERINGDLKNISSWAQENQLLLNPRKSTCLFFSRSNINSEDIPLIYLDGEQLPYSSSIKSLGVYFNGKMECCEHINYTLRRIYGGLRQLWLSGSLLSSDLKLRLVKSLIIPHFTYCRAVYPLLDAKCTRKVNVAFNDCVRFVYNLKRYDHVSSYANAILECPIQTYIDRRALSLLHKLIVAKTPSYLYEQLNFLHSSRHESLLIPRMKYKVGQRSFFVVVSRLWNSLPNSVRRLLRTSDFKNALNTTNVLSGQEHN